jgi:hypothetical protein
MTEQEKVIPAWTSGGTFLTAEGETRSASSGNQTFKPVKPENLVRPQGVKPPPPGRTK